MTNPRSILSGNRWLRDLSPETISLLTSGAAVRRLGHGEQWASRSETAAGIAVILAGGLRSISVSQDGRECVFSIMKEGDVWGVVSSIDELDNPNDVYTHGPTTLLVIDRQTVQRALGACLDFNRCLLNILTHRLRMANAVIEDRPEADRRAAGPAPPQPPARRNDKPGPSSGRRHAGHAGASSAARGRP